MKSHEVISSISNFKNVANDKNTVGSEKSRDYILNIFGNLESKNINSAINQPCLHLFVKCD